MIASLGREKNEPFVWVGEIDRPDLDSGSFWGNNSAPDSLIRKGHTRAILKLLSEKV